MILDSGEGATVEVKSCKVMGGGSALLTVTCGNETLTAELYPGEVKALIMALTHINQGGPS